MKKNRVIIALMVIVVFMFALAACTTQAPVTETPASPEPEAPASNNEPAAPADDPIVIGYSAFTDTFPFSKTVSDNLRENVARIGATLLFAENNGDAQANLQNIDTFITQGANYLIDSSWVIASAQATTEKANAADIPIIVIDMLVEGAYFIGANNEEAGLLAGHAAADYAKANWDGEISWVMLTFSTEWGEAVKLRVSGVPVAIREDGIDLPEDRVVWMDPQSADTTIASKQLATDFLTAHPNDKNIVFATANDDGAIGILAAIEAAGRSDDCIIVSQNNQDMNIENLRNPEPNSWIGSVAYLPEQYGDVMINNIILPLHEGKTVPWETFMPHVFVDRANVDTLYPQ